MLLHTGQGQRAGPTAVKWLNSPPLQEVTVHSWTGRRSDESSRGALTLMFPAVL